MQTALVVVLVMPAMFIGSWLIAEAMQKVGNTGVITIEEGTSLKTELDVVTGI